MRFSSYPGRWLAVGTAVLVTWFATGGRALPAYRAAQESPASLTVSAAISLKDALDEIAKMYEQKNPGVKVTFNYGGSGTLQHQIEQGAPVDIFFSAAEKQMDALVAKGLTVAGTRRDAVRNSLVLIVPAAAGTAKDFSDLVKPEVKTIALGEPATVPAGMYAQQTLQHLGLMDAIKPKVVYAKDVRQVLTYVETGNADAGLVYRTDALISKKVRIVATAPEDSHEPIVYPLAVIKGTKQESAARGLADYLAGADAHAIFKKYGFAPLSGTN
ncbi:MAG: molybdate ABC transporter substrate-binding protein [Candidatus Acidiferrales bacterium]